MLFCTKCGAKCEDTQFCTQCGAYVGEVSTPSNANNSFTVVSRQLENVGDVATEESPEIPGFVGSIQSCVSKYGSVKGRASRSEFWNWILFLTLFSLGFVAIFLHLEYAVDFRLIEYRTQSTFLGMACVYACVCVLFLIIPTFTVFVRRLHDSNTSGAFFWGIFGLFLIGIGLSIVGAVSGTGIIFVGAIACGAIGLLRIMFRLFKRGTPGENRFGLEPQKRKDALISNQYADGTETPEQRDPNALKTLGFIGAITTCIKKYFSFQGRASRSEFWNWIAFLFIINVVLNLIPLAVGFGEGRRVLILQYCFAIALTLPTLSVYVRRLHDVGKSEWIMAILGGVGLFLFCTGNYIIPTIFFAFVQIWLWDVCFRPGTQGENCFGLEPQKK